MAGLFKSYLTSEQIDFAKKWIAALRSGEYEQGSGVLHDGEGFCCLGVACDLAGAKWQYAADRKGLLPVMEYAPPFSATYLPWRLAERIGLSGGAGEYGDRERSCLSHDNDNHKSFDQIADLIESELELVTNGR